MGGGLGFCGYFSQVFLVIINVVFALLGAAFVVVGCLLRFQDRFVIGYIDELFTEVKIEALSLDLSAVIKSLAIILIVIGAVVLLIGIFGIIGACCRIRLFLVVYAIILILLFIAEIVAIVLTLVMKNDIDRELKKSLKKTITDSYTGDEGTDSLTKAWNYVFFTFDCCGVDGYQDFLNVTKWNKNSGIGTYKTPLHCCHQVTGEYPKLCLPSGDKGLCAVTPMTNNSNFEKGCYEAIENWLRTYGLIEIIIGACFLAIELLSIILAFCLCRSIGNVGEKYKDDDSNDVTRM